MTHFTVNEHGNRVFEHAGWEVRIWEGSNGVSVTSPSPDHEVTVDPDGIWVKGSCHGSWGDGPSAFTIPWAVIEAIVEARAIVG